MYNLLSSRRCEEWTIFFSFNKKKYIFLGLVCIVQNLLAYWWLVRARGAEAHQVPGGKQDAHS
ncbi:MAG TPA: hypothetical protein VIU46_07905 [Gallionellaceae bacterium]